MAVAAHARGLRWVVAVVRTARPRQWPKNLLVFAAPLAGASLGRRDGLLYALAAAAAFGFASAAVYFVNDVVDAERDRLHPRKRYRPVASGALPKQHAVVLGAGCAAVGLAFGLLISEPLLTATVAGYLALSFLYSLVLKHIPVIEVMFVASGFLLRVLGGAAATHVPPSGWFLLVCSLGAFGVAIAKRYTELTSLGAEAIRHRPVLRFYRPAQLRIAQIAVGAGMIAAYVAWAAGRELGRPDLAPGQRPAAGPGAGPVRLPHRPPHRGGGGGPDHAGHPHAGLRAELAGPVRDRPLPDGWLNDHFPERGRFSAPPPAARRHFRDRPGHPRRARPARRRRGHPGRPRRAAAGRGGQGTACPDQDAGLRRHRHRQPPGVRRRRLRRRPAGHGHLRGRAC